LLALFFLIILISLMDDIGHCDACELPVQGVWIGGTL
jgi:hypothetical protein